jgi:putative tryptophan/tyrosine transport system substrate-binding protein
MRRREVLLTGAAATATTVVLPVLAQQSTKPRRIGYVVPQSLTDPASQRQQSDFLAGLRERGWVEGQNLLVETRLAEGQPERLGPIADELVALGNVEVIVAVGTAATREMQARTRTIPIVMIYANDPVASGLVASLARPGGNVTGIATFYTEVQRKQVELLRGLVTDLHRVAVLWDPSSPGSRLAFEDIERTARSIDLTLLSAPVSAPEDLDRALATIAAGAAQGLYVQVSTLLYQRRRQIAAFAMAHGLPTTTVTNELVRDGLLMSYGPDTSIIFWRAGYYVDRLLRGAKAAELPVEQSTKFQLVINLRTAKVLGLTIPPSLLARADEVIE